jgi:putative solute:sodium symporter small subunit
MSNDSNYHISFFRPTTERAKTNRNIVLLLVSIWAVAIFGFHFVMRAIEKPTPEPELVTFNSVWESVQTGNASEEELKQFANSALHVAGKVFIKTEHRNALDNGISWVSMQLADSAQKIALKNAAISFNEASKNAESVSDQTYIKAKNELGGIAQQIIGVEPGSTLYHILPLEINAEGFDAFTDENKKIVAAAMPLYMIHNQSVLTDTKFLGFPFHYFYSAVFLLILFIALCYAYCVMIDKYNKKMEIAE